MRPPRRLPPGEPIDWDAIRASLGIPYGWTLRPKYHGDYWTLTANARRLRAGVVPKYPSEGALPCGHRSMQSRATNLPLAVSRMARTLDFHRRDCG